jgi:hypothetical protein
MINETRLPIRCCPEKRHGKSSGFSNLHVARIATALNIYNKDHLP